MNANRGRAPWAVVLALALAAPHVATSGEGSNEKNLVPSSTMAPLRVFSLSLEAGDGGSARRLGEALERLPAPGARELQAQATAEQMRSATEGLLSRSREGEMVVLTLSAPAHAAGGRFELLGADGLPAFDLDWLQRHLDDSDASFALVLLELAWSSPPPPGLLDQVQALAGVRKDILVLDGPTLSAPSVRCPGQRRGSCALSEALGPGSDTDDDGAIRASELIAATRGWLAADGGDPEDLSAFGWHSDQWKIEPGMDKMNASTDPRVSRVPRDEAPAPRPAPAAPPPVVTVPIELCLRANGSPVPLDYVFRDGETLALAVRAPDSGYLALGSRGPEGAIYALYPDPENPEMEGRVTGGVTTLLPPPGTRPMRFRPPAGAERLTVVWSEERVPSEIVRQILEKGEPLEAPPAGTTGSQVVVVQRDGRSKDIRLDPLPPNPETGCGTLEATGTDDLWILDLTLLHAGAP